MTDDELKHDQRKIRETNLALIEHALEAIEQMKGVADATEHPRAYEVLFKGIKDAADINNSLMDNQVKAKNMTKQETKGIESQGPQILAVTTDDLLRTLQDKSREEKDITPKQGDAE